MKPNKKYVASNGKQVCMFPMDVLNITQTSSPSSFSHCCGHPADYVGKTAKYPVYAPCDCHQVYSDNEGNTRGYTSDDIVNTPSGLDYVSFSFTHNDTPPTKTSFKQGELIAYTGTAGFATGDHTHIDQAFGQNKQLVSYGITCSGGNLCYALDDSTQPYNVFYVNDTDIINAMGLPFKTFDGTIVGVIDWIIPTDINGSRPLSTEEMQNNAKCFYGEMNLKYGMSLNAVCGILGNAQSESTINPARWQGDDPYHQPPDSWGYGLVQWTPYTKILDWLEQNGYPLSDTSKFGEGECKRLKWELDNNQQWIATSTYPQSFQDFWTSDLPASTLALMFLANYERPYDPNQPIRATQATEWYEYLKDYTPVLPGTNIPVETKRKGMPVWMMIMRR